MILIQIPEMSHRFISGYYFIPNQSFENAIYKILINTSMHYSLTLQKFQ